MPVLSFKITETDFVDYKKKTMARRITTRLVKQGVIKKSSFCQLCNQDKKTEAHHTDYGRPTDIMWLCDACHGLVHREESVFNPKNIYQTPIPLIWDEKESVTVSFTIPSRNFIAIKKQAKELKVPLSKLLRDSVINFYSIESNQLTLNFENTNNEKIIANV